MILRKSEGSNASSSLTLFKSVDSGFQNPPAMMDLLPGCIPRKYPPRLAAVALVKLPPK